MQGIYDYIIEIDKTYNETMKTESGLELHVDRRFSDREAANRIGTVVNIPAKEKTVIKKGYQIMFDPVILLDKKYEKGTMPSPHLLDEKNKWYKLKGNLIALYREDENSEWKAFGDSFLVEPVKDNQAEVKSSLIYIPESAQSKNKKGYGKVTCANIYLEENGIYAGDEVYLKMDRYDANSDFLGITFRIDGKIFKKVRNIDLIGKVQKN